MHLAIFLPVPFQGGEEVSPFTEVHSVITHFNGVGCTNILKHMANSGLLVNEQNINLVCNVSRQRRSTPYWNAIGPTFFWEKTRIEHFFWKNLYWAFSLWKTYIEYFLYDKNLCWVFFLWKKTYVEYFFCEKRLMLSIFSVKKTYVEYFFCEKNLYWAFPVEKTYF